MTVVIHEFEVVAEKPPTTEPAGAAASAPAHEVAPSTPQDIDRIVRRIAERGARVRAH